ncbi:hypothetical protein K0M31_004573, partial [Melipona bicolor]
SRLPTLVGKIKIFGENPEDEGVGTRDGKSLDTSAPRAKSRAGSEEARRLFRAFAKENALESGSRGGHGINSGPKAVDGKLVHALNRLEAYVKAHGYT